MELLRFREMRGLMLAKFLTDAAGYFHGFWLPKYLYDARGFDYKATGLVVIPPAASVSVPWSGSVFELAIPGGHSVNASRKAALCASAAVMSVVMLVPYVSVPWTMDGADVTAWNFWSNGMILKTLLWFITSVSIGSASLSLLDDQPLYLDPAQPIDKRVDDLISRMTLEEKAAELDHKASGIARLNIPKWGGWNQCLHGVMSKTRTTTLFPVSIAMGATWDPALVHEETTAISDEARAVQHPRNGTEGAVRTGVSRPGDQHQPQSPLGANSGRVW